MLTELQEKWLTALESGHYKQGKGSLRKNDAYCCLGVACEVCGIVPTKIDTHYYSYDLEQLELPQKAKNLLNIRHTEGCFTKAIVVNGRTWKRLTNMNDNNMSFKDIAATIRANPEKVFNPIEEA